MPSDDLAASRVRHLVEAYAERSGLDFDAHDVDTVLGDIIRDLMHLATAEGTDWREAAAKGIWQFRTMTIDPSGETDGVVPDREGARCLLARRLGVSYGEAARRLSVVDVEPLVEALQSHEPRIEAMFVDNLVRLSTNQSVLVPPPRR